MPHRSIDANMELASAKLVERDYFTCEKLCAESLAAAFAARDYQQMARILMPLQEARRQRRQLAEDADRVVTIGRESPTEDQLGPAIYLIKPPRVAAEGRALREHLDRLQIPAIILTREPTTLAGKIPVVSIGPVTLREHLAPPPPEQPPTNATLAPRGRTPAAATQTLEKADPMRCAEDLPIWWLLWAVEQLGDGAIADAIRDAKPGLRRVEQLYLSLQALPEHDKLHQVLAEACLEAARLPAEPTPAPRDVFDDDRDEPDEIGA